jgi:hypothetical protein
MKKINAKNKSCLLIGDFHAPYHHADYLEFCKAVYKENQCDIVINMGDEVDGHSISFHDADQELFSAGHELELAIEHLSEWNKAFPKTYLLDSNHGSLVYRRAKHHGIPMAHFKQLKDLYETPKWSWHEEILLSTDHGNVYLCHGKTGTYNKLAKEMGCSAVQGHFHGKLEITWQNTGVQERFNMFVGCGINRKSLAFAYGKNHIPKPMLGCGVIDRSGIPKVYKMKLNKRGRWIKKL